MDEGVEGMTVSKEKWLFLSLIALIVILTGLIFTMWVSYQGQSRLLDRAVVSPIVEEIKPVAGIKDLDTYDELISRYREQVAPIEVNGIHKRIESAVLSTFHKGKSYSKEEAEALIYPLLEQDLTHWAYGLAVDLFRSSNISYDEALVQEFVDSVSLNGHMDFMMLYEILYLKNEGISITNFQ